MPLKLSYKLKTGVPVEVDGIVPNVLAPLSLEAIERLEVQHGNERLPLAEAFTATGNAADGRLEFVGELAGVHRIGAGMTTGRIDVAGAAGRHAGSQMTGGEIHVAGDSGDWLGAEMHGGSIHVHGNAGNLVGSAYRGSERGMTGGTILVAGNVGDECGHTMRRGLLAVGGSCGVFVGINMIAGSVLVFGDCGRGRARPCAAEQSRCWAPGAPAVAHLPARTARNRLCWACYWPKFAGSVCRSPPSSRGRITGCITAMR